MSEENDDEFLRLVEAECSPAAKLYAEIERLRAEVARLKRAVAAERERAARVCDDEARLRTEAGNTHPEDSAERGRCFAGARAAINCVKGIRGGEEV